MHRPKAFRPSIDSANRQRLGALAGLAFAAAIFARFPGIAAAADQAPSVPTAPLAGPPSTAIVTAAHAPGPLDDGPSFLPGDVTADGKVALDDLISVLGAFGVCPNNPTCPADLNGDSVVDIADVLEVLANWS